MDISGNMPTGRRINTVCSVIFEVTDIMDRETFLPLLKAEVDAAYGKKSRKIVETNWAAIDETFAALVKVDVPAEWKDIQLDGRKQ